MPFSILLVELLFATGSGDEVDSKMLASLLLELRLCLSDKIASIENEFLSLLFCCILCFVDFNQYKSSCDIKLLKPKVQFRFNVVNPKQYLKQLSTFLSCICCLIRAEQPSVTQQLAVRRSKQRVAIFYSLIRSQPSFAVDDDDVVEMMQQMMKMLRMRVRKKQAGGREAGREQIACQHCCHSCSSVTS